MTDPDTLSDADLVRACQAGQQAAWSALVRRYQRLIYTVPRRAGLSEDQAADVFQFTFTRLYQTVDRLDQPERVQAWLVTTARRETLRLLSERQREAITTLRTAEDDDEDPLHRIADEAPLPPQQLEALQEQDRIRRAVQRLDDRSRLLITLLFLQDEPAPYSEIARRLNISEGSIGPTRARALEKLRQALARDS